MAQQTHGVQGVRPHEHDRIDDTNRAAFEENLRIIKRAWTEDYFSHRGQFWQVPPPGTPWNIEATERWGSGVRNGVVTELAVVPKPLQKPHPPIFQPFASSERTIRFCAEEGITPILPPLHPLLERRLIELYAEVSGKAPGEGVGVLRDLIVADTDSEALQIWMDGPVFCGASWFRPFGFDKGMLHPDTGAEFDGDRFAEGLAFVGTVDTVTRQLETLRGRIPVEWVFAWNYNGLVDDGRIRHSMEAWRSTIVPRVAAWD
ncbi:MAG: LLM class flavin-dependent oxidoreductase [Acidimicrobiales bacterium]|nr:LLM class flavin-dependent oxidoreductase [Acidimicrobiales bacterium]